MQIERHVSSLLNRPSTALSGGAVQQSASVNTSTPRSSRAPAFPDAPRLSSQPLRYNVQLNEQLTSVQQAENFLQTVERQLVQFNHSVSHRTDTTEILQQAQQLKQTLSQRQTLSGGTVDRNMQVSLSGQTQVNFALRNGSSLMNGANDETLIFSLAGSQRELSGVALSEESHSATTLLRLNQALGRWGIHGELSERQVRFSVSEAQWPRVSQHLSVQGEGTRFPQGQFVPLRPQAESALEERIQNIIESPAEAPRHLAALQRSLQEVTDQREQLAVSKASVRQSIESMATFSQDNAVVGAQRLADKLTVSGRDYGDVATALGAQANVHAATVRNVLSV
ncbi:hypothetical protein PMPD1_0669 [Paramixta manurensis]|uniref:Flagellar hook-associated protein n=1 Tax=Paramixta manurensis TaxID=2740817 RepID=A0A6M8U9W2_9GAMM|nr:hypothetical protein PMPD1_0669 [Erwiniaceae bacterium PD-1]